MRILKIVAILMVALVVAAVCVVGYYFTTAKVSVVAVSAQAVLAEDASARFTELRKQVEEGVFQGTLYSDAAIGDAKDYVFVTYTLRLSNQCLVPIDMIEVQAVPKAVDVLKLGDRNVYSLGARSEGDISATILTSKDVGALRELVVTYYVWGVSFSLRERF